MRNSYNDPLPASPPVNTHTPPTRCPTCRSLDISTTARVPDAHAYWRCGGCGEIWNAARRDASGHARPNWR